MPRAKVVSFINYKGGVGKTTTTYHIGCSLAQHHDKRVLLVDIDPQTNLTFLCAPYEKWKDFKSRAGTIASMYKKFQGKKTLDTKRFIWREPIKLPRYRGRISNLDLIPCDVELLGEDLGGGQLAGTFPSLELLRRQAKAYLRERMFLRNAFREIEKDYDYVLIDCPPNLYLMTQNALVASDWYVVTTIPDHLSTIGLTILTDKVQRIAKLMRSAQNFTGTAHGQVSTAKLGGFIFVRVRLGGSLITKVHLGIMRRVRTLFGKEACFSTNTTELIGFSEAAQSSVPVWEVGTTNAKKAARKGEYRKIAEEFLRRF